MREHPGSTNLPGQSRIGLHSPSRLTASKVTAATSPDHKDHQQPLDTGAGWESRAWMNQQAGFPAWEAALNPLNPRQLSSDDLDLFQYPGVPT